MADDPPGARPPLGPVRRALIAGLLLLGVTVPALLIRKLIEATGRLDPTRHLAPGGDWQGVRAALVLSARRRAGPARPTLSCTGQG